MIEDEEITKILVDLINNQEDIPPEFVKVLNDNFWELIQDNEPINENGNNVCNKKSCGY